jgi:hypothetical protein
VWENQGVINPNFVYLALALSLMGSLGYVRSTLRGDTTPNRISWSLWAFEGILSFIAEVQQHVGLASLMTLMLGCGPILVILASFKAHRGAWNLSAFDIACGVISLAGLAYWLMTKEVTVGLVSFVVADQVAALPTVRKAFLHPETEHSSAFIAGAVNCTITLLTLRHFTTAGVAFPGAIAVTDAFITFFILTKIGTRFAKKATLA